MPSGKCQLQNSYSFISKLQTKKTFIFIHKTVTPLSITLTSNKYLWNVNTWKKISKLKKTLIFASFLKYYTLDQVSSHTLTILFHTALKHTQRCVAYYVSVMIRKMYYVILNLDQLSNFLILQVFQFIQERATHSGGGFFKTVVHFHKRLLISYVHFVTTDHGNLWKASGLKCRYVLGS